jgi:uncharacterized Zn-binding protein involved in type VI secretion
MGNVVRIGDKVSCGDFSADGASTVFANNIAITTKGHPTTTGHDGYPPTVFISNFTSTVFVENQPVAIKGSTKIKVHCKKSSCHDGTASSSSSNVSAEA